jgi:hypothetical protein
MCCHPLSSPAAALCEAAAEFALAGQLRLAGGGDEESVPPPSDPRFKAQEGFVVRDLEAEARSRRFDAAREGAELGCGRRGTTG